MVRRLLVFSAFVCGLALFYVLARPHLTWEQLIDSEAGLRAWLDRRPWSGFSLCFTIYVGVSLIPGTTGKAIIAGWLFGFWRGIVLVNLGLTAAAILSFWLTRYIFRDAVAARFGPRLTRANDAIDRDGANYLFIARVLHTPFCLTNYLMGATRIRLRGFWWATQLGVLPANLVYVYAGAQAPSLLELETHGLRSLLSPGLIVAFIAVSLGPVLIHRLVRRWLARHRAARVSIVENSS